MNKVIETLMNELGVKVNEKFNIIGSKYNPYYFDKNSKLNDRDDACCKALIYDLIHGIKKIEKLPQGKFVPEKDKRYWLVTPWGSVSDFINDLSNYYAYIINHNLVFKTCKECEDYKWFLDKVDEYKKPFECGEFNYCLSYDVEDEKILSTWNSCRIGQGVIYFGKEDNINAFIKEVGEERIKKYMFDVWE